MNEPVWMATYLENLMINISSELGFSSENSISHKMSVRVPKTCLYLSFYQC